MSYNLTPITAKIKKTTKGGITQPLLNVGAPVKMKVKSPALATKPKEGDLSSSGNLVYSDGGWRSPRRNKRRKAISNFFSTAGSVIKSAGEGALKGAVAGPVGAVVGASAGAGNAINKASKTKAKAKAKTETKPTKTTKTKFAGDTPYTVKNGKGTIHGPKSSYDAAYKKRDRKVYGEMSKAEYVKEAKRQTKSFESTGKFDAPKAKKAKPVSAIKPKVTIESKKPTANVNITVKPKAKVAPKTKAEVRKTAKINKKLSQAAEARAGGNEKKALRKEKAAMRKAARAAAPAKNYKKGYYGK